VLANHTVEPHYDNGKHCYWKPVNKAGMQKALRLGLQSRPYPKPMIVSGDSVNYDVDPQTRKGQIVLPTRGAMVVPTIKPVDGGITLI